MSGKKIIFNRAGVLLLLPALLYASPVAAAPAEHTSLDLVERKPYIEEAAGAVVGRVFGVEGDASNIQYHEVELTAHTPSNAAIRSLLIPGWGQYFNGQRAKGTLLFLTTIAATLASVKLYDSARESYDDYIAKGSKDDPAYEDYTKDRTGAYIFGGAAIVLWVSTVIDAHRNAYNPLYTKQPKTRIELTLSDDKMGFSLKSPY